MYTETLSAQDMDDLCSLLQQAHFKGLSKRLRTAFLTLSISCTPRFAMPKRKISVPFSLTPFRQAALADCISLLQYIGSQPDMPHYLQYRLAETESLLRLFLLDVPTRILYLEFSADGQLTFCAASNRVPQLLRSALWNTREPTILTSGTLTAAGDFDHTEQLLGLAAYAPLRHFRAESPFNYRKNVCCISLHGGQRLFPKTSTLQTKSCSLSRLATVTRWCCSHPTARCAMFTTRWADG